MGAKSRNMKGKITEHLLIEYMDSEVDQERMIPTIVRRLLPIPEEQKEYAREHIGEEVEFVKWDGGRTNEKIPHIGWIQYPKNKIKEASIFCKGKHVLFENPTDEQMKLLDHYVELSNQGPRRSAQISSPIYSEDEVMRLLLDLVDGDSLYECRSRSDQFDFVSGWFERNKKK